MAILLWDIWGKKGVELRPTLKKDKKDDVADSENLIK